MASSSVKTDANAANQQAGVEQLLEWSRIQSWPILFQNDPLIHRKKPLVGKGRNRRAKKEEEPPTNALFVDVELRELKRNRDGRYLYEKILKISPENLFPDPNYYILRYRLPSAPFEVEVSVGKNVSAL